jgi:alkaline phosphatase D
MNRLALIFLALTTIAFSHEPLRVMIWNTERGSNPYGPKGKLRVLEVIRETSPDLVLWQESYALEGAEQTLGEWAAAELGWNWWQSDSAHLCVVTPHQIASTFTHESFHGVGARIRTPGDREFVAWSTWIDYRHYLPWEAADRPDASDASLFELETHKSARYKQTQELLWRLDELGHLASNLPVLVGGDWNSPSHLDWTEATATTFPHRRNLALPVSRLMEAAGFSDTFRSVHPDPVEQPGPTWSPLLKIREDVGQPEPPERIDRLYLKNPARGPILRAVRATTLPRDWNSVTLPRETSIFPSDHAAVVVDFEWIVREEWHSELDDTEGASLASHPPPPAEDPGTTITRFGFGSCYQPNEPAPALGILAKHAPQLYVALGDNIYGDTKDMELLARKYRHLGRQPEWRDLAATCPIIATWDDHDYGADDSGREYPLKKQSKSVMLDFFLEPTDSPRRTRPGIYTSYLSGPEDQRVQFILLDLRTFRSSLKKSAAAPYPHMGSYIPLGPDDEQIMLGEEQWSWLEAELRKPATFRFIGLSTQLGVGFNGYEAWANLPAERERFFQLLESTRAEGVILLSGDTHWAELNLEQRPGIYGIFDLTSSGINQGWAHLGHSHNRCGPGFIHANTGLVEIDWQAADPAVTLRILDASGVARIALSLRRSQLDFSEENLAPARLEPLLEGEWKSTFGTLTFHRDSIGSWSAIYDQGTIELRHEHGALEGRWREGERSGACRFVPSRCGRFIMGAYGRGDGPALLAWPCWREGSGYSQAIID